MAARWRQIDIWMAAAMIGFCGHAAALPAADLASASSAEQQEADYRVVAARCGTPAFEKAFHKQSMAAVAAGLVTKNRPAAEVEKTITALRRSPLVLVAASADCPAQLAQLKALHSSRSELLRGSRKRGPAR